MTGARNRGEVIRAFILMQVEEHRRDIARVTAERFAISRQAVHGHLRWLIREGVLEGVGGRSNHSYVLRPQLRWVETYKLGNRLDPELIWRKDVKPRLGKLRQEVLDIWQYGVTALVDNVSRHADASRMTLRLLRNVLYAEMVIEDDGVGIFRKIRQRMQLAGVQQARLELAERWLRSAAQTSARYRLLTTARLFDAFGVVSAGLQLCGPTDQLPAWLGEGKSRKQGTLVWMKLGHNSARTVAAVVSESTADFLWPARQQ